MHTVCKYIRDGLALFIYRPIDRILANLEAEPGKVSTKSPSVKPPSEYPAAEGRSPRNAAF